MAKENHKLPKNVASHENAMNHRGATRVNLGEYIAPMANGCATSIVRPPIQANNFET